MRRLCLFAVLAVGGSTLAQPPAPDELPKLPDLKAKEWKPVGSAGLKMWDVKEGTGAAARTGDTVTIHYTGWFTDGKSFDSSVTRRAAATFPLDRLIKGWQEGIPGMKAGGVRRLYIPYMLAYGEAGRAPRIPPKADLVFEIELYDDPTKMPNVDAKEWKPAAQGLKTWDVRTGTGKAVQPGDTVTIHYTGWTTDGKSFDSSRKEGRPATFPLGNLVQGWQLGIPGMKEGGIRRLLIPSALGYGDAGSPPAIPGGATLVFEIEVQKTGR